MTEVRVRFAPSPTGDLHIGGARTALFNWLFARRNQGVLVLRLEDTDNLRSRQESAEGILAALEWLGLDWDEGPGRGGPYGPYQQSQRLATYREHLQVLLDTGRAYYCYCTADELKEEKETARLEGGDFKYSGRCRHLDPKYVQAMLDAGRQPVIRLKAPGSGQTIVKDLIRGDVVFENSLIDDFIIAKSDGWPTYNFAVVVDDHLMRISHVIRAEEHLSNTPRQILIYNALGWSLPEFAHVSMILAPDRSKLSKRHGATSVQEFRDQGYLPDALLNYLSLLGWSTGRDVDYWTLPEMAGCFDLSDMNPAAAVYDIQKLTAINAYYLNRLPLSRLIEHYNIEAIHRGWMQGEGCFEAVVELVRSRLKLLNDFWYEAAYFFEPVTSYDEKGSQKHFQRPESVGILQQIEEILLEAQPFQANHLEGLFRQRAAELQLKAGDLIHPCRLAISGRTATPGLFDVMALLGRQKCQDRVSQAIQYVKNEPGHKNT